MSYDKRLLFRGTEEITVCSEAEEAEKRAEGWGDYGAQAPEPEPSPVVEDVAEEVVMSEDLTDDVEDAKPARRATKKK